MTRHNDSRTPLERIVSFILLAIGSALPFLIAWFLIASTNDENPLDNIPDYEAPQEETLTLPLDRASSVRTVYRYRGKVRVVIEGSGQLGGSAYHDLFYVYTDAAGDPLAVPQLADSAVTINGEPALIALDLEDDPLPYNDDHFYTAIYDGGFDLYRLAFKITGSTTEDNTGAFTITVIDIDDPWDR